MIRNKSQEGYDYKGRLMLLALVFSAMCGKVGAQCATISLQGIMGSGVRGKVGFLDCPGSSTCPTYYLEHTTGIITAHMSWSNGSYDMTDNGTKTVIDPTRKYDGTPMPDTCPEPGGFETTTYLSGSVVTTGWCPGSDPMTSTWHKNETTGNWYIDSDPDCMYDDCAPPQPSPYWEVTSGPTTTGPCNDLVTTTTYDGGSMTTEEKFETEYPTSAIEAKADATAKANLPTSTTEPPWVVTDPTSSRKLSGNDTCATATLAKYRFRIEGANSDTMYLVSWVETTTDASGTISVGKQKTIRGQPGIWYWPSSAGEDVPPPVWPPNCSNGGEYSVKYSSPSIAVLFQ